MPRWAGTIPKLRRNESSAAATAQSPTTCSRLPATAEGPGVVGRMASGRHDPTNASTHSNGEEDMDPASRRATYIATNSEFTISSPNQLADPVSRYLA